jgi:DNA replication protein DnaC
MLRALRLRGILETMEIRIQEAISRKLGYQDFLTLLIEDEIERRRSKRCALRMKQAGCEAGKTIESFDFSFNPAINQKQIFDLVTCRFVERKENVWFCGPSGVGKTHLALALAHQACRQEIDTVFISTSAMLARIHAGRADGTYPHRLKWFLKPQLLILDEFCLKSLHGQEPEDLYEVINGRHEKTATILTSNRAFSEWPEALGDPLLASAILDRIAYNAHRIEITGKSYRTKARALLRQDKTKDEKK